MFNGETREVSSVGIIQYAVGNQMINFQSTAADQYSITMGYELITVYRSLTTV